MIFTDFWLGGVALGVWTLIAFCLGVVGAGFMTTMDGGFDAMLSDTLWTLFETGDFLLTNDFSEFTLSFFVNWGDIGEDFIGVISVLLKPIF